MSNPNVEADIVALEKAKPTYEPSEETRRAISNKVLVMVVGPSAVGKTTAIKRALEINVHDKNRWELAGSLTTRRRRPDDPLNYRTADEGVSVKTFREMMEQGILTNYSIVGQHIYGSSPETFPARYNFLPILTDSIAENQAAGFERTETVYLLSEPEAFGTRLGTRAGDERLSSRLHEALVSLDYAEEHIDELQFLENNDRQLDKVADALSNIALGVIQSPLDKKLVQDRISAMRDVVKKSSLV